MASIKPLLSKASSTAETLEAPNPTIAPPAAAYDRSVAPRFLVIGTGSRGNSYARAIRSSTNGVVVGVAEINDFKRKQFCERYGIEDGMAFKDWKDVVTDEGQGRLKKGGGVDGVLICVLDHMHIEVARAIIPFGYHVLCEKPLAINYEDCLEIQKAVEKHNILFAVGHVLRYSPHNILLKRLVCEEKIIGDVVAIEHTEPIGWYHFAHSYVRGNWHNEKESAPSILTKCCHDLDLLLWLLCSPSPHDPSNPSTAPHLPSKIYSTGALSHFKPSHKPAQATSNCITCPSSVEEACIFSAKKIYIDNPGSGLVGGYNTDWPVDIVYPEIEDPSLRFPEKKAELIRRLATGPYGRCVYDGHNDVVDNQVVVMSWDGGEKTATLNMTAFTHSICERRTKIYGTLGEIQSDTSLPGAVPSRDGRNARFTAPNVALKSVVFAEAEKGWTTHTPSSVDLMSGHGGGDTGLAGSFVEAVEAVKIKGWEIAKAQREIIGGGVDEVVRAHGVAWAAEESRKTQNVVDWKQWDEAQRNALAL